MLCSQEASLRLHHGNMETSLSSWATGSGVVFLPFTGEVRNTWYRNSPEGKKNGKYIYHLISSSNNLVIWSTKVIIHQRPFSRTCLFCFVFNLLILILFLIQDCGLTNLLCCFPSPTKLMTILGNFNPMVGEIQSCSKEATICWSLWWVSVIRALGR